MILSSLHSNRIGLPRLNTLRPSSFPDWGDQFIWKSSCAELACPGPVIWFSPPKNVQLVITVSHDLSHQNVMVVAAESVSQSSEICKLSHETAVDEQCSYQHLPSVPAKSRPSSCIDAWSRCCMRYIHQIFLFVLMRHPRIQHNRLFLSCVSSKLPEHHTRKTKTSICRKHTISNIPKTLDTLPLRLLMFVFATLT